MKVILIFVDGLGIGDYTHYNPCVQSDLQCLGNSRMQDGSFTQTPNVLALDATMGIRGLPQSATGQSALLTGLNTAQLLGRHLQGFPNQILRERLKETAIPVRLKKSGLNPVFVNAYRPEFFTLSERIQWRLSVTTVVNLAAGLSFKTLKDLENGQALYHDFTNQTLIDKGYDVPPFSPEEAGGLLAALSETADFLIYEYFLTDRAGHLQDIQLARRMIRLLDRFLSAFFSQVSRDCTIILTSDHGNIEDLSIKTHTRNPVMTLIRGDNDLYSSLSSIQDVAPAILNLFGINHG